MKDALLDAMARYLMDNEAGLLCTGPNRRELINRWQAAQGDRHHVPLWYVAHPVSGPCACPKDTHVSLMATMTRTEDPAATTAGFVVACNVARARTWLRWLLDAAPRVSLVMSWLPYLDVLPDADPGWRERGMRDDCAVAAACAGIILVGGRTSRSMERERNTCASAGGDVVDLGYLGAHPPDGIPRGLPYPLDG